MVTIEELTGMISTGALIVVFNLIELFAVFAFFGCFSFEAR